jgi:hypothetical protein
MGPELPARDSDSVEGVEPTRPHLGALVSIALILATTATAAVAVLVAGRMTPPVPPMPGDVGSVSAATLRVDPADGPYAFWAVDADGEPLRWDPCEPVTFVLDPLDATPGAEQDLRTALERLADATGMELVLEGLTEERPNLARPLVEASGSGWRWRPVLVAWARPGDGALPLTRLDRGIALPVAVRAGERETYVTGQVVLNAQRDDLVPGFEDRSTAIGATLLHELAHLLGLDHVEDASQLMSVDPGRGPVMLGDGDRAGLERIGRNSGCNPAPPADVGRGLTVGG